MILALSSEAAPNMSLEELAATCERRGIALYHEDDGQPLELNPILRNVDDQFCEATKHTGMPSHIILRGGGPEAAQFEGRGIGTLMTRLSISGYQGMLILAPSSSAVLPMWQAWLRQRKSWGCGSKTADPSLVQLGVE